MNGWLGEPGTTWCPPPGGSQARSSAIGQLQSEFCQPLGVYEAIDLGDLSVGDGERHHREQSPGRRDHCSSGTVDKRRKHERIKLRVRRGVRRYGLSATE